MIEALSASAGAVPLVTLVWPSTRFAVPGLLAGIPVKPSTRLLAVSEMNSVAPSKKGLPVGE